MRCLQFPGSNGRPLYPARLLTLVSDSGDCVSDHLSDPAKPGMDRRTMIKAAAIAGAGAWTAPVIIDSLMSPAAAFTAGPGCYRFVYQGDDACNPTTGDPVYCPGGMP